MFWAEMCCRWDEGGWKVIYSGGSLIAMYQKRVERIEKNRDRKYKLYYEEAEKRDNRRVKNRTEWCNPFSGRR